MKQMIQLFTFFFLSLGIFLKPIITDAKTTSPKDYSYKVTHILDGDTFTATDGNIKFRVRIAAMDAPEYGQPYGKVAKFRLKDLLLDRVVIIAPVGNGYDRYGRVLGQVYLNNKDIALTLITEGLATYYRPTCQDYPTDKNKYNFNPTAYIAAEHQAKIFKKEMWSQGHVMLPCQFRKLKR